MKIKKYWVVSFKSPKIYEKELIEYVVKAKKPEKAIDEFYKIENSWYLRNGYKVLSVKPLEVEVLGNE